YIADAVRYAGVAVLRTPEHTGGPRLRNAERAIDGLRPRVRSTDAAHANRHCECSAVLLRLAVAEERPVGHALVCEPDVHYAEVVAALDRPARVGLARCGELLVAIERSADARPPANARPLQRRGPHRRIGRGCPVRRLALVRL